jgi:hypothetical protein
MRRGPRRSWEDDTIVESTDFETDDPDSAA